MNVRWESFVWLEAEDRERKLIPRGHQNPLSLVPLKGLVLRVRKCSLGPSAYRPHESPREKVEWKRKGPGPQGPRVQSGLQSWRGICLFVSRCLCCLFQVV